LAGDHDVPSYVNKGFVPCMPVAAQKLLVGHDTDVRSPLGSIDTTGDHDVPL
jgi:hypothetical protein